MKINCTQLATQNHQIHPKKKTHIFIVNTPAFLFYFYEKQLADYFRYLMPGRDNTKMTFSIEPLALKDRSFYEETWLWGGAFA